MRSQQAARSVAPISIRAADNVRPRFANACGVGWPRSFRELTRLCRSPLRDKGGGTTSLGREASGRIRVAPTAESDENDDSVLGPVPRLLSERTGTLAEPLGLEDSRQPRPMPAGLPLCATAGLPLACGLSGSRSGLASNPLKAPHRDSNTKAETDRQFEGRVHGARHGLTPKGLHRRWPKEKSAPTPATPTVPPVGRASGTRWRRAWRRGSRVMRTRFRSPATRTALAIVAIALLSGDRRTCFACSAA